jgi:putative hemolysin
MSTKIARLALASTLGLFAFVGLVAAPSAAGPECDIANKEYATAQATLSKATRDADMAADAYGQCMTKGGSCSSKKATYDQALSAKNKALAAMKAATNRQKNACR